jgi:hypothetical protein
MGKKSGSGSGMNNNSDHISESLETVFLGLKYLNFLMRIRYPIWDGKNSDPGWKKFGSWIRDGKIQIRDGKNSNPGSGINIQDPQHWLKYLNSVMRIRFPGWKKSGSGMMIMNAGVPDGGGPRHLSAPDPPHQDGSHRPSPAAVTAPA